MLTDNRIAIASANIQEWTSHSLLSFSRQQQSEELDERLERIRNVVHLPKTVYAHVWRIFLLAWYNKNIYDRNFCEWNSLEQPNSESMQTSFLAIDPFIQDSRSASRSANILSAIFFFLRSSRSRQFFLTNLITAIYFESAIVRNRSWKIFSFQESLFVTFVLFFISRSGSNEIF